MSCGSSNHWTTVQNMTCSINYWTTARNMTCGRNNYWTIVRNVTCSSNNYWTIVRNITCSSVNYRTTFRIWRVAVSVAELLHGIWRVAVSVTEQLHGLWPVAVSVTEQLHGIIMACSSINYWTGSSTRVLLPATLCIVQRPTDTRVSPEATPPVHTSSTHEEVWELVVVVSVYDAVLSWYQQTVWPPPSCSYILRFVCTRGWHVSYVHAVRPVTVHGWMKSQCLEFGRQTRI